MTSTDIAVLCNSIAICVLAVCSIMDAVVKRKISRKLEEIERRERKKNSSL